MVGSCTTNQENWTMLGVLLAGLGAYFVVKWLRANPDNVAEFATKLSQLLRR